MSKIIGVTVGTPTSPAKIEQELKPVKTVNGVAPDGNGNVEIGGVSDEQLTDAVNDALELAKASGAFKGDPGERGPQGPKGETGAKGEKGDTGATGAQGEKGDPGPQGPRGEKGETGAAGKDGAVGANGKDGTSATHSWNGTTLTITSASGTSSADLKGEPGKDGNPGKDGSAGADGVSPTVAVSKSGKVTTVSITDKNGTKTATINDGADGSAGSAGKDGTSVTVKSVSESTADGGSNVVTFSDGKTLTIKNGSKGSTGASGKDGSDANVTATNIASALGYTPAKQSDVEQKANKQGLSLGVGGDGLVYLFVDGAAQGNGLDIKAEAVAGDVVGYVDENNTIILTGALADGTYTFKYEDDEGNTHEIGNVTLGEKMVNQIPISTDTDGVTIFNGTGWKTGERVSSSGTIKTQASYELTGFMPFVKGDVLRGSAYILLREAITDVSNANYNVISLYDVNKTFITNVSLALSSAAPAGMTFGADRSFVFDSSLNSDVTDAVKFIRVTCAGISNGNTLDAIITINQEIE